MKRLVFLLGITLILLLTGCSPEVINGLSPRDIPVKSLEYKMSGNGEEYCKLIIPEHLESADDLYDCSSKPTGNWKLGSEYRLTEFKANEDTYYYLLEYQGESNVVGPRDRKEYYKIVRTEDGWKHYLFFGYSDFEYETQGLEPKVVKEVHDRP